MVGLLRESTLRELDFLAPILDDLKYWREFKARGTWAILELGPSAVLSHVRLSWRRYWRRLQARRRRRAERASSSSSLSASQSSQREARLLRGRSCRGGRKGGVLFGRGPSSNKSSDDDESEESSCDEEDVDLGAVPAPTAAAARAAALSAMLRQRAAAVVELNRHVCAARRLRQRHDDNGTRTLLERGALFPQGQGPPPEGALVAAREPSSGRDPRRLAAEMDAWMLRAVGLLRAHFFGETWRGGRATDLDEEALEGVGGDEKEEEEEQGGGENDDFLTPEEWAASPRTPPGQHHGHHHNAHPAAEGVLSMRQAVSLADEVQEALDRRLRLRLAVLAPHRRPSWVRRHWLSVATLAPASCLLAWRAARSRELIRWAWRQFGAASQEFINIHIVAPTRAIVDHVFFLHRQRVADAEALADASRSLEVMLSDWLRERYPHMAEDEVTAAAKMHDMARISAKYEKALAYSVTNIVTGDLVRMILIQVQFIKRELLVAMAALESATEANDFNFRAMATVPAILLAVGLWHASERLSNLVRGRPSKAALGSAMQALLRELERLLPRSNDDPNNQEGLVLLCIHQIKKLVSKNKFRFSPSARMHILEDLAELAGERGDLEFHQRLLVVQRIQRWHPFLRPSSGSYPDYL